MDIRRLVTGAAALWVLVATGVVRAQTADPGGPSTDVTPAPIRASLDGSPSPGAFSNQIVQPPAGPPATPRHTGIKAMVRDLGNDVKHLPAKENLLWVGIGSGVALAIHPFDENVNQTLTGNATAEGVFRPGAVLGSFGTLLGTSTAVYAVGRLRDAPRVSHVGMDLIQALAVSEGLTQGLKYATRRERPDQSGRNSFPSGHSADAFAFATALERHLGWRFAVPAYVLSSYVAISRLPANRHWASDVCFGAAVGIIAGRTVTGSETQGYPLTVAFVPGGVSVMFLRRNR